MTPHGHPRSHLTRSLSHTLTHSHPPSLLTHTLTHPLSALLCTGSEFQDAVGIDREQAGSRRLQHSHSDMSPHHSLDSASMSPVYNSYLQHQQAARMPSPPHKSVTLGAMDWPQGHSRGGEGGGGRRGDWQRGSQLAMGGGVQEAGGVEALQRRLRIDVTSPVRLLSESICLSVCLSISLGRRMLGCVNVTLQHINCAATQQNFARPLL